MRVFINCTVLTISDQPATIKLVDIDKYLCLYEAAEWRKMDLGTWIRRRGAKWSLILVLLLSFSMLYTTTPWLPQAVADEPEETAEADEELNKEPDEDELPPADEKPSDSDYELGINTEEDDKKTGGGRERGR
jgi:hypothetical protein